MQRSLQRTSAPGRTGVASRQFFSSTAGLHQATPFFSRPAAPPVQACTDKKSKAKFKNLRKTILKHGAYKSMSKPARKKVQKIIKLARTRKDCLYYLTKLKLLLDTPTVPGKKISASFAPQIKKTHQAEKKRLATPAGKKGLRKEEAITANKSRKWETLQGKGATFQIDRSDPKNIVVHMKVRMIGNKKDVANVEFLEDSIEKHASTKGYIFDITFVKKPGKDVFDVKVDSTKWPTSGNWVPKSARTLAHEAHHRLGLKDRYDYIKSHAGNKKMAMETRVHWFLVQMGKPDDPQGGISLMGRGKKMLDDDVCRVAQLNLTTCQNIRKGLSQQKKSPIPLRTDFRDKILDSVNEI